MADVDITEYLGNATLHCDGCEFETDDTSQAMMHALVTRHSLEGVTPDEDVITISIQEVTHEEAEAGDE